MQPIHSNLFSSFIAGSIGALFFLDLIFFFFFLLLFSKYSSLLLQLYPNNICNLSQTSFAYFKSPTFSKSALWSFLKIILLAWEFWFNTLDEGKSPSYPSQTNLQMLEPQEDNLYFILSCHTLKFAAISLKYFLWSHFGKKCKFLLTNPKYALQWSIWNQERHSDTNFGNFWALLRECWGGGVNQWCDLLCTFTN